jgi:hypothetical protein
MISRRMMLSCMLALVCRSSLSAQNLATALPAPAGPRTIVGVVTDTSGRAIDSVEVFVTSVKRRTTTNADGTFRFDDVKAGTYQLNTRKLGFFPQVRSVKVDDAGGTVAFRLVRSSYGLPAVVTTSTRPGLSGVVGDTAYNSIAGAEISVLASSSRTRSDSTGAFYLDLKPGGHAVRITRPGFTPQLVSVTVPPDSGRRIVVWLTPLDAGLAAREGLAMDSLADRLLKRNPVWSKVYTREDIAKLGMEDATQLAIIGAVKPVSDKCEAVIDGGPYRTPLWTLNPRDFEMMEVYTERRPAPTVAQQTAVMFGKKADTRGAPPPVRDPECAKIYVWLRK